MLVNSRLDLFLVLFSPPRGPLSFLFHFSPCLSLFDTTKPASHGPGFRSGALPPRQENRGEARRRARRRASSSGSSRSFVLAFVVVVAVRCTPRAASAIPPRLGPRREHQHFYPRGTTRERSLPPTRLRRKRRSTGGGREREREKERKGRRRGRAFRKERKPRCPVAPFRGPPLKPFFPITPPPPKKKKTGPAPARVPRQAPKAPADAAARGPGRAGDHQGQRGDRGKRGGDLRRKRGRDDFPTLETFFLSSTLRKKKKR